MALKTYGAHQIARFFLAVVDPEDNDISNLKLQKLCYYAQGVCSAMRGKALFSDSLEAWDHGPVVPTLYHEYKPFGSNPIAPVTGFNFDQIDKADREAIEDVHGYYGQFSAWRLRNMTHEEAPWVNAAKRSNKQITVPELIDYFSTQVDDEYANKLYPRRG